MFDVGFWELMLIGLVALVVIGPERLPGVARTAGKWLGKGKRMLTDVKAEIDQEIKAEELKQILEVQKQNKPLQEIIESASDSVNNIKQDTDKMIADLEGTANSTSQAPESGEQKSSPKTS
ncbi:MAG: Sec-independent protein translocase protein TatB [Gammaproteobacteria bacterium]|jgi:sec-independent protein translocase protein TatB